MGDQQLHSWKEIAGYLGVTPRTAQCWEKKLGLPVHRRPGGPKAPVFAYAPELDDWLIRKGKPASISVTPPPVDTSSQDAGSPAAARASTLPVPGRRRPIKRWLLPIALVSVLLLIALPFSRRREPATAEIRGKLLMAMDSEGEPLWSHEFPEADDSFYSVNVTHSPILVADIDSDGHREVLFNYKPRPPEKAFQSKLICFGRSGRTRWEFVYGRAKRWGERQLSPLYFGSSLHMVRERKNTWILTVAKQIPFFPSQVAFLDPKDGAPVWEYWHPGHLSATLLADLDGDGNDEILLSGINNPGPGIGHPALVALKAPVREQLPPRDQWQAPERWGGGEYKYILFPRSAASELLGGGASANQLFMPAPGQIGVGLAGGLEEQRHICWTGVYRLDSRLEALSFRPHDCFRSTLDWLAEDGKVQQSTEEELTSLCRVLHFRTAPDANSKEVSRLWNENRSSRQLAARQPDAKRSER